MKTRIKMQISSNSCPPAATKVPQKINKRRARNFILNVQKLYFQELNPSTPQLHFRPDTRPDKPNKFFKINYRVEQTNLHTQAGSTVRRGDGEMGSRQKGFFLCCWLSRFHATKQIKQNLRGSSCPVSF